MTSPKPKYQICPRMIAFDHNGLLKPIYCGSWKCPVCRRRNAAHWAMRVKFGMRELGHPIAFFWTMTMPGEFKTPEHAYAKIPRMWDSLRKRMQRLVYPRAWLYCAFVEGQPHRDGMPHFHIITFSSHPATYKRFKDFARHYGFGFESESSIITGEEAAGYVSKYASKDAQSMPKGFRRVRVAEEWPEQAYEPYIVKATTETTTTFLLRAADATKHAVQILYDRWQMEPSILSELRGQTEALIFVDIVAVALYQMDTAINIIPRENTDRGRKKAEKKRKKGEKRRK